ncbi:hypothetical protein [Streptodolium elevatio]|uniref:Uncharacterized protein n=1 Tax=Streptodolium elevatio TaxID=3157996 RepID=A0ABV3DJV2_9ACTN
MIASIPRAREPRVRAAQPQVFFHAEKLDEGVRVLVADDPELHELHIFFNRDLDPEELAEALTEATRHNVEQSHWVRLLNTLLPI